jgi:hypothetical protein
VRPVPRGGDDRVPLTRTAATLGAIVLIAGAEIDITRPDGTETRIHGVTPETVADARNRDPLAVVRDGEAWVHPKDLAALLGSPADSDPGSRPAAQDPPAFETFQIQKPTVAAPAEIAQSAPLPARLTSPEVQSSTRNATVEVTPVPMGLGFSRMLALNDPDEHGFYLENFGAPRRELDDRMTNPGSLFSPQISYLSLDMGDGARRYQIGDMFDPIFGTSTGMGFLSALSGNTRAGASLVVPVAHPGDGSDGHLAFHADTVAARHLTAEAEIATDATFYTSARWDRPEFTCRTALMQSHGNQREDTWWRLQALPRFSLYGRSSALKGDLSYSSSALGLSWDARQLHATLERAGGDTLGEPWAQDSASLSYFGRDFSGIVRYVVNGEDDGRAGLEWSITRSGRRGYAFLSSSAPEGPGDTRTYRLGASAELKRRLRGRFALASGSSGVKPELSLEYRPSQDQLVSLAYGSFELGAPGSGLTTALVVQASLAFGGPGGPRAGVCEARGTVTDDSGHGVPDVAVVLDAAATALTKADGTYEFTDLETGRHAIRLDPGRVPADYASADSTRVVYVSPQEPGDADFSLTRLCRISGAVYVESSATHQREPLSGVVVLLNSDLRTTTDSQGRYTFGGLKPGKYTVSYSFDSSALTLTPMPPTSWAFRLQPGESASGADFGFLRRDRPLVFGQLGSG